MYKKGADLKVGDTAYLVAGAAGVANEEQARVAYLVTDQRDRKGNPLLVNVANGATVTASPHSVWTV